MHHFFLEPDTIQQPLVRFPNEIGHQIRHVLRLTNGDLVGVLDNSGMIYTVELRLESTGQRVSGKIVSSRMVESEPNVQLGLFFALSSRDKVEWILQKATEIGVSSFYPFVSSRSLVTALALNEKKQARWVRIIQEAAEQCRRGKLPVLNPPAMLEECLDFASRKFDLCLIAWEGADIVRKSLAQVLSPFDGKSIALFVGPEGGFSEDEVAAAVQVGCRVVSLSALTLRMETAALVFPALVRYHLQVF